MSNPKFDLGQQVWFLDVYGKISKGKITVAWLSGEYDIKELSTGFEYVKEENEICATEEEAIKAWEKSCETNN